MVLVQYYTGRSQIKNTVHKVQQSVSAVPVTVPTCTLHTHSGGFQHEDGGPPAVLARRSWIHLLRIITDQYQSSPHKHNTRALFVLLLLLFYMLRSFNRQPSSRGYKYKKEQCIIEDASPSQST